MKASQIRCSNDLRLFDALLEQPDVKKAKEHVDSLETSGYTSMRRRLLATSVRLSRSMAQNIHAIADSCIERLELDIPLELYVYSSPQYNAACLKPEDGRLIVMFSSSLLEAFSGDELRFVMGHELGHHLYGHHDIPIGLMLNGENQPGPKLALDLFAWSRYAEISADRAGAHCAKDLNATALALFKLASGLSTDVIEFNLEDFLSQIREMQSESVPTNEQHLSEDWFSTHPFSPLRVQALKVFFDSEFAHSGGNSAETLELAVQNLMGLMEPSYLEGRTESAEAMRRLLFAAAITVAQANGAISEEEIRVFEEFFGAGAFTDSLDVARLEAELPQRIEQAQAKTSLPQRIQVLRDLCLIAKADGCTAGKQQRALESIAAQLEVESSFVAKCLEGCLDPD
jgi:tellurite resistance protein